MPNKINDGARNVGSQILTITKWNGSAWVARGTYATDNFNATRASNEQIFTDDDQIPTGQFLTRQRISGDATLQLASQSTEVPDFADRFQANAFGSSQWFFISSVGRSETKDGETKVPISFVEVLNPTANGVQIDGVTAPF